MLKQVTTFEETKSFLCSVWMLRMTLTWILKRHSNVSFDIV